MPRTTDEDRDYIPYKDGLTYTAGGLKSTGYGQESSSMNSGRGGSSNPTATPVRTGGTPTVIQSDTRLQTGTRIQPDHTPATPPNRMAMPIDVVPPQRDLVPLWDNSPFYGTPDTVTSPTDCNRWPSSPYCGGNPFDWKPIGIDVDAVNDGGRYVNKEGCNIGIQVGFTIAFIKLPRYQIVARNPWCKPEPPPPPPKEDEMPDSYEFDLGEEGVVQYLEIAYRETKKAGGFLCSYADPKYPNPSVWHYWDEVLPNGGQSPLYRYRITGVVKFKVIFSRQQIISSRTIDYCVNNCQAIGNNQTIPYDGYGKTVQITDSAGTLLFWQRVHVAPKYFRFVGVFSQGTAKLTHKKTSSTFEITDLRLENIPLDVDRYFRQPPPDPPWEPPPPPPEPREKRDYPEECECMCCDNGNVEALIAMLMKQLANQAAQIANLQNVVNNNTSTIINNINEHDIDLTPVLNDTSIIKAELSYKATSNQLTNAERNLGDKIDNIKVDLKPVLDDLTIIKEKLDRLNEKVDLSEILRLLNEITVAIGVDDLPLELETINESGEVVIFDCDNLVDLILCIAEISIFTARRIKSGNADVQKLIDIIGSPVDINIFDENVEEKDRQIAVKKPGSLFEAFKLSIERGEVTNQTIGIERYPIVIKPLIEETDDGERGIIDQIFDIAGVIDPFSWILDPLGTLQSAGSLVQDAINQFHATFGEKLSERTLHNQTDLINYLLEQVMDKGDIEAEFPIVIEKDQIDGTEDIEIHSLGDAVEEIITLLAGLVKASGYHTDMAAIGLVEAGHIKAIAAKTYGEVSSIQDFMDYPTETVHEEMPLNISIVASPTNTNDPIDDEMKRFLTPGKISIVYDKWTSRRSFMSMMRDVLQQTASARSSSTIID